MELHLKVTPDASPSSVKAVGAIARGLGARRVRQLFPGRRDAARRSLYVVDLDDGANAESVLAGLRRHEVVESVEPAFDRELA